MSDINKDTVKEEAAKGVKKNNEKKNGFFSRVGKFFREIRAELNKISWPTFAEVVKNTIITLVAVAIIGTFIGLLDWGISSLRDWAILQARGEETAAVSDSDIAEELNQFADELQGMIDASSTDAE